MFEALRKILSRVQADYADVRYEIMRDTRIVFHGRELFHIGTNVTDGYVLRVLKNGGFSPVAFTRHDDAGKAVRTAVENAELMSLHVGKPVRLAENERVRDTFLPRLREDPKQVPVDEKLALVRKYNALSLDHEKIATTSLQYSEVSREKYFASTEGTEIREDLVTTSINGLITSRDGSLTQNVRVSLGGSDGFASLRGQEHEFEQRKRIALDLLNADPVAGGTYPVVLNQDLAGVFTHEAFGHFSEADLIEDAPLMREKMQIGARLGSESVSIVDDPLIPGQLGFYRYDDEGVAARRIVLMEHGVLTGRLHSRRTAASFGEGLTGHCVAEDYRYAPLVRMGNIFIEPGGNSLGELIEMLGDGLYIIDAKGGQTSGENFTFGAQYGYLVKGGKRGKMIRDINISGNLYHTLKNIAAVGDDLVLSKTGGCGKGQLNIRSCHGAPHTLIRGVVVGGA